MIDEKRKAEIRKMIEEADTGGCFSFKGIADWAYNEDDFIAFIDRLLRAERIDEARHANASSTAKKFGATDMIRRARSHGIKVIEVDR